MVQSEHSLGLAAAISWIQDDKETVGEELTLAAEKLAC